MSNQIKVYKETIRYLLDHRHTYFPSDEQSMAINQPSEFLKTRTEIDRINDHAKKVKDLKHTILEDWDCVQLSKPDSDLIKDIKNLLEHGSKIGAIKLWKNVLRTSLKDALHEVTKIQESM